MGPTGEAYIYIDESGTPSEKAAAAGPFHVGALHLSAEANSEISRSALQNLSADPLLAEEDRPTLERGYFHASYDSWPARKHFATCIVEANLRGEFRSTEWHFNHDANGDASPRLHETNLVLSLLSVFDNENFGRFNFVIAEREGSFSTSHARHFLEDLHTARMRSVLGWPFMKCRFPPVRLTLGQNDDPGVQQCDYFLWAVQRSVRGNTDGLELLRMRPPLIETRARGTPLGNQRYVIGAGLPLTKGLPNTAPTKQPTSVTFAQIETHVREAARLIASGVQCRIAHHATAVDEAMRVLAARGTSGLMESVARAFLLTCDTEPLYDSTKSEVLAQVHEERRVAAFVLFEPSPERIRAADYWRALLRSPSEGHG